MMSQANVCLPSRRRVLRAVAILNKLTVFVSFCIALMAAEPARAVSADLSLVLAVDVSASIDDEQFRLQRQGYIQAMTSYEVLEAIRQGTHGRIAVAYFEWSDAGNQALIVDWLLISDEEGAGYFRKRLEDTPRPKGHFTSISSAVAYALDLLRANNITSERQIIDISGDGRNNDGPPLEPVRTAAVEAGVTINGLPIFNYKPPYPFGPPPEPIDRYFEEHVIAGPGAFIVVAENFDDFERAVRQKLVREIAGVPPRFRSTDVAELKLEQRED